MLPPKKSTAKKPNPAKKYKNTSSEVDWDKVRAFNDNTAVQLAKVFDPTGISSYPDVYYAAKDLAEGKGSWGELGLNVLGALPMVGKSKVLFKLNKASNATKTVKNTKKVLKTVEKVAEKANKIVNAPINKLKPLATSTKVIPKVIGKGAQKTEAVAKTLGKPLSPKNQVSSTKQITKTDAKNVVVDLLDIGNVAADVKAVTKSTTEVAPKQEVQPVKPVTKEKVKPRIVYYNTNPKHGEVETPGKEEGVSYAPITNSIQLEKWKNQKLAYGTNSQGIMKKKMNPVKRYANGTNAKGMDPNHYIISPAEALNDYNIMLAKAEAKANSNPWLPIVAIAGQALQTGIGIAGKAAMAKAGNAGETDEEDKAAMGMNNVQQDVEVEGGEMFETPQGQVGEFKGPSHEQGGIPLEVGQDVEEGTKVYSDRLKIGDKTLAERKATRERQIANLEKIASDNLADEAVKNAAKRKMMAIQKEEAADLQFQDQVNNLQAMADTMVQTFACGTGMKGVQKMDKGGIIGEPKYDKFGNPIVDIASLLQTPGVIPSNQIDYSTNYQSLPKTDLNAPSVKEAPVIDLTDPKNNPANYETNIIKNLHDGLGITPDTPGYGTAWGVKSNKALFEDLIKLGYKDAIEDKEKGFTGWDLSKQEILNQFSDSKDTDVEDLRKKYNLTNIGQKYKGGEPLLKDETVSTITEDQLLAGTEEAMRNADIESDMAFYTPGQVGTPIVKEEEGKKEPSKLAKVLEGNMPAVGDITKLIGNYLGMTAGIKTAAEQRSTDVTHRNVFANAGEESQRLLDNAKQGIETSKAQAIVKATTVGRGGKKGARGSARGVNTMRGMDWLYDTALQQQIAEISANAANQIANIDTQKSQMAMNADQLKGQGEYQAAMANEAAKDAYYTALGLGRKDFATGLQQTGKDLNDMKENKIIEGLMKQYGTYFIGDKSGVRAKTYEEITGGKEDKKGSTTSEKLEVKIDTEGNEYIIVGGKKQLIKRK